MIIKNVSSSKTRTAEDSGFMDEELEDAEVSKDNTKSVSYDIDQFCRLNWIVVITESS